MIFHLSLPRSWAPIYSELQTDAGNGRDRGAGTLVVCCTETTGLLGRDAEENRYVVISGCLGRCSRQLLYMLLRQPGWQVDFTFRNDSSSDSHQKEWTTTATLMDLLAFMIKSTYQPAQLLLLRCSALQKILEREFVYVPGLESTSLQNAITRLQRAGIVNVFADNVHVLQREHLLVLWNLISPYILNFALVIEALLALELPSYSIKNVLLQSQKYIADIYAHSSRSQVRLSFLSTEPIKNAGLMLISQKVLLPKDGGYTLDRSAALKLLNDLTALTTNGYTSLQNAKI
ncbi:hypothetical protein Y032_0082g1516 [Ancylostoma ceylanicum]|uniref:GPAT/DHAPAT C-terminal domain-containing protein n=1 Tax=Ancylostoma ceylanicum TaxID=53326 RepID=A0A016TRD9_9BILA|nr:hypothetical protein Y032_0082g1516 [Ancylostoma ceylanicum]